MKLTKKLLNKNKIYNSWDIAQRTKNKLYVSYIPAENDRNFCYAKWVIVGIGFNTNDAAWWGDHGKKIFTVTCRKDKELKLQEAIKWVSETYKVDICERDVFGNWHIRGTLEKLQSLVK